jgi:hypothetical protein
MPTSAPTAVARKSQRLKTPAASVDLADQTTAEQADATQTPESISSDGKPRSSVVKLGGALKRLNPFRRSSVASNKDEK